MSKVQASEVKYELSSLGWKAFQNLCVTITSELWGQTVQSFYDSHDGGRDGAFRGVWKSKGGEDFDGSFTIQCKFTATNDKLLRPSDLRDELSKAKRLASIGLCDNYFLFTNARLTGVTEGLLNQEFLQVQGIKKFKAYGPDRISLMIRESSRLRMLVPRLYGLGDLSQILDDRAQNQAREILSALGDDLAKFVITDAYRKSAKAIVDHGFVLLLGEPACGKSTIAAALAVGALDEWGCSTYKIRCAEDFVTHSNPHEPKQLFWVDDAFGATQLDWSASAAWNQAFPHIHAAIRRGARFIFTSRDYIYKAARNLLKESALPVISESQVVIHVDELSKDEREQILYNHIRLGNQHQKYKSKIKPFLPRIAMQSGFSPEIARRLGNSFFTKELILSSASLEGYVLKPVDMLSETIRTLADGSKAALALVFMRNGMLPSPISVTPEEENALKLIGGSKSNVVAALTELKDSLVILSKETGCLSWRFKHPTIRDAFAIITAENRELMDIYLSGAPIDMLLNEITCGDLNLKGVKVIVPSDRYDFILKRLKSFQESQSFSHDSYCRFLSRRCDRAFLSKFFLANPNFFSRLTLISLLRWSCDIDVMVRFHEFSLLPESNREAAVACIHALAIDTPDAGFLDARIRKLFTPTELAEILFDVRTELLPNLNTKILKWRSQWQSDEDGDPESYFDEFTTALRLFREEFASNNVALGEIDRGLERIVELIDEMQDELPAEPDYDDFKANESSVSDEDEYRSIFDDVDA